MAITYDHAVTDARRLVDLHRPVRRRLVTLCLAGCDEWPCRPFSSGWAIVTRNSNTRAGR